MKKTSFLAILLAALVLAAGVVTKDSELVKSYVPVLLEQLQAMDTAVPKEMPPKAEAKTQDAVKLLTISLPLLLWILDRETVSWYKCREKYPDRQRRPQRSCQAAD